MPTKNELVAEGKRIVKLLERDFVLPDGTLTRERVLGAKSQEHLFPDLGDVVLFLDYFGGKKLVKKQIDIFKKSLEDGIMTSQFPTLGIKGFAKSYEYSDLLLGLIDNFVANPTAENKRLCIENIEKAINIFRFNKNICSFYHLKFELSVPIIDTRDSMFVEILLDAERVFSNPRYGQIARNIYEKIRNSRFFKKNNLLPTYLPVGPRGITVCKNNTNTLFAWLALYLETRDEEIIYNIKKLLFALEKRALTKHGGVVINLRDGPEDNQANLTASCILLDFSCDMFKSTGDKEALVLAERIANFWLKHQASTGLFPLKPAAKNSFLDSETDMTIALFKLYELTANEKYKSAADRCFSGIWQYHGKENYPLMVDVETGNMTKNVQRTKFLALFLKLLILKISILDGKTIYGDRDLWSLLRDR